MIKYMEQDKEVKMLLWGALADCGGPMKGLFFWHACMHFWKKEKEKKKKRKRGTPRVHWRGGPDRAFRTLGYSSPIICDAKTWLLCWVPQDSGGGDQPGSAETTGSIQA